MASATYATLEDAGRSRAVLRFALDLALKMPSPLSCDIANSILDICHNVQHMSSTWHAREWLQKSVARARETNARNRRAQMDFPRSLVGPRGGAIAALLRCSHWRRNPSELVGFEYESRKLSQWLSGTIPGHAGCCKLYGINRGCCSRFRAIKGKASLMLSPM